MLVWYDGETGKAAPMQITFKRTIVGWYNVRLAAGNANHFVNLSPAQFAKLVPNVSSKTRFGCAEISVEQGRELLSA